MKRTLALFAFLFAAFLTLAPTPVSAVQCRDGSFSTSSGPGTCSWHGGIDDGTPSWGGGGGTGSDSDVSGIYWAPSTSSDDDNDEVGLGFWIFIGGVIWFWIAVGRWCGGLFGR
jgi:hypothetical protein